MARIVTVYNDWHQPFQLVEMGYIRWLKISEALARRGHEVDIATAETGWGRRWWRRASEVRMGAHLRRIRLADVRWGDYDVVKTLFHEGFETLERYHGVDHPFLISKLGSVVGARDREGIPFYGSYRERLYAIQERIHSRSTYVTVISKPARALWEACHGPADNILVVPGAADREVPAPSTDPFPSGQHPRCLFAGHVYFRHSQPEANAVLVEKLNQLGMLLSRRGVRLYMLGPGDVSKLDSRHVTYLGTRGYEDAWNYLHFADVGVVVAAAAFLHNNESTKIYHYLRVGLPVVSEAGFPNDHVIGEARLGFCVENGNLPALADAVAEAARARWDRQYAVRYILEHHTWDQRVGVYDDLIVNRSTS